MRQTFFEDEPLNSSSTFWFGARSVAYGVHSHGFASAKEQACRLDRLVPNDFKHDIVFNGLVNNIHVSTVLC